MKKVFSKHAVVVSHHHACSIHSNADWLLLQLSSQLFVGHAILFNLPRVFKVEIAIRFIANAAVSLV
jgi:hypothetical protein